MSGPRKTAIATGASQGIGAGIVKGLVERGFDVVAHSRKVTQSTEVAASNHVALVVVPEEQGGVLKAIRWRRLPSGQEMRRPIRHLLLFIGADPNTD